MWKPLIPESAEDVAIAVMGPTGSGKSTFVAQCTRDRSAKIGHSLLSCTTWVSVHSFRLDGRNVHLIDTPGFDDTRRSDAETLQELAYWLMAASEHGFRLSGIIYLHRITDPRFHGYTQRCFNLFKAICGEDAFPGVVVATTMWGLLEASDRRQGEARYSQLRERIQGDVLSRGAKLIALSADGLQAAEDAAHKTVRHIMGKNMRLTLALQTEIVDMKRPLQETQAGKILYGDMLQQIDNSIDSCKRDAAAMIASLDVTCEKLRVLWEKRMEEEDQICEQIQREYEDALRSSQISKEQSSSENLPISPATILSSTSDGELESKVACLEERLKRQRHKLQHRRYSGHGWGVTSLSVIGTGLAVGQLVAAVSCNVM
ncbi:hypothetical protein E8E13_011131 [Curvularia kusanoi]|uniref:G domain-containing protein n=1 Tax=Curvularia kusanoi TaxID=90978 RepID=A0A9P4WBQ2_CURKU|nr:hypothetical protein E8E13_011131 [Curvularia kusanoi]